MDAALEGDEALAESARHRGGARLGHVHRGPPRRREQALAADPDSARWGPGSSSSANRPSWLAGVFKGPPRGGVVELGYEIAESPLGAGTRDRCDTREWLLKRSRPPRSAQMIAHTLPERNASNRVLEKVGFHLDGEAAEGGELVWRFRMAGPSTPRRFGPRLDGCRLSSRGEVGETTGPSRKVRTPQGRVVGGPTRRKPRESATEIHRLSAEPHVSSVPVRVKWCGKSAPASR